MKTLYSSTFLSAVLGFLMLLGTSDIPVTVDQTSPTPSFQTIIESELAPLTQYSGVKIEVFNHFECQNCQIFGQGVFSQLIEKYSQHPQIDFKVYLIPNIDQEGDFYATRGAYCASKEERFWEMIYELHSADALNKKEVDLAAQTLELPITEFRECLESDEFDAKIEEDKAYANSKNILQKPSVLVNSTMLLGAQPIENIDYIVRKHLKNLPSSSSGENITPETPEASEKMPSESN